MIFKKESFEEQQSDYTLFVTKKCKTPELPFFFAGFSSFEAWAGFFIQSTIIKLAGYYNITNINHTQAHKRNSVLDSKLEIVTCPRFWMQWDQLSLWTRV